MPEFELFDHTADLGLRLHGQGRAELAEIGVQALYAAIGEVVGRGPVSQRIWEVRGADEAVILRDFLAEVLHVFETEQCRLASLAVDWDRPDRLTATGQLQAIDTRASHLEREVKAVTYHELTLVRDGPVYSATLILDI